MSVTQDRVSLRNSAATRRGRRATIAKGQHGDYERIGLPSEFSPSGNKLWLLLYRDKPRIKIAGYEVTMRVVEVQNRKGGGHVVLNLDEVPVWSGETS